MTTVLSIITVAILIALFSEALKKKPVLFYGVSALISTAAALMVWAGVSLPAWVNEYIMPIVIRGGFSGALFIVVMVTGALPNGSYLMKKLMPLRAQLSIIAGIFTLGHNVAYGKTYFVMLFSTPANLPVNQLCAAVCSVIMLAIMLPLFITSFKRVRRKMRATTWKKLQRAAYVFYALMFIHVMLLTVPGAIAGRAWYRVTVLVYSLVYLSYLPARLIKQNALKHRTTGTAAKRQLHAIAGACAACIFVWVSVFSMSNTATVTETASAEETGTIYKDGVYTGSAFGNSDYITVSVTVENGAITRIEILEQYEDEPYWSWALEETKLIIAANSTDVDTVSMATYSSEGIRSAVKNALKAAVTE